LGPGFQDNSLIRVSITIKGQGIEAAERLRTKKIGTGLSIVWAKVLVENTVALLRIEICGNFTDISPIVWIFDSLVKSGTTALE
jgi:hypothetical protein